MSLKFHINESGNALPCRATVRPCAFGGESGIENHFESAESARSFLEASMASESIISHRKDDLVESTVTLSSNLGTFEVDNGDLSNPNARLALSSGLCGGLALAIHNVSNADIYFVTHNAVETEESFQRKFEKDPSSVFEAAHVVAKSFSDPDAFIDSYGHKSREEIEDFYEGALIIRGSREMAERFAGTDHENLKEFALSAIELDRELKGYTYEDFAIEDEEWDDEEDYEE
jgi:hypothetical protein